MVSDIHKYSILVAEWIHFTLLGIVVPTIKLKVYTFLGLVNSATKIRDSGLGLLRVFRLWRCRV